MKKPPVPVDPRVDRPDSDARSRRGSTATTGNARSRRSSTATTGETMRVCHCIHPGNCTVHLGDGRKVRFDEQVRKVPADVGAALLRSGVCWEALTAEALTSFQRIAKPLQLRDPSKSLMTRVTAVFESRIKWNTGAFIA